MLRIKYIDKVYMPFVIVIPLETGNKKIHDFNRKNMKTFHNIKFYM